MFLFYGGKKLNLITGFCMFSISQMMDIIHQRYALASHCRHCTFVA